MSAFSAYTLGFGLYYWGLKRISAVLKTSLELTAPVFGALGAFLWLDEEFSLPQWVTGGLPLIVVFWIARFEKESIEKAGRPA